jgi:hypothetical protein
MTFSSSPVTCPNKQALEAVQKENEKLKKRVEELIDIHYTKDVINDLLLPKSKQALKEEIQRARRCIDHESVKKKGKY